MADDEMRDIAADIMAVPHEDDVPPMTDMEHFLLREQLKMKLRPLREQLRQEHRHLQPILDEALEKQRQIMRLVRRKSDG